MTSPEWIKGRQIPQAGVLRNTSKQGCKRPNHFENEPGVAVFYYPKPYKRTYRTLRIPESVAKRVYQRSLVLMKPLCGKERSSFYGSFQPLLTWFSNWSWRSLTQGA